MEIEKIIVKLSNNLKDIRTSLRRLEIERDHWKKVALVYENYLMKMGNLSKANIDLDEAIKQNQENSPDCK